MFHPLQSLFGRRALKWEESDIRHYIQRYLQERLHSEDVYCEQAKEGVAIVRVGSATAQQEVTLWEFDLARDLKNQTGFSLQRLTVRVAT